MSRESSLSNIVTTFKEFRTLFDISSSVIDDFLRNSFLETEMTEGVSTFNWSGDTDVMIIGSSTSQYSEEKIRNEIEKS